MLSNEQEQNFDPYIGSYIATTWWDLGKQISELEKPKTNKNQHFDDWLTSIRTEAEKSQIVNPDDLIRTDLQCFISNLLRLLESKYHSDDIANELRELIDVPDFVGTITDHGQYIRYNESARGFWASEYDRIFDSLRFPQKGGKGWLEAVTTCGYASCNKFFIKSRRDQRFHSDTCRAKTANKLAAESKRKPRR